MSGKVSLNDTDLKTIYVTFGQGNRHELHKLSLMDVVLFVNICVIIVRKLKVIEAKHETRINTRYKFLLEVRCEN